MNHCIGDRPLDPPEDPEVCERCGGWGWIDADEHFSGDCPDCQGDAGEPNDYPDE
jgi:DnaJ-class molecular chaperone